MKQIYSISLSLLLILFFFSVGFCQDNYMYLKKGKVNIRYTNAVVWKFKNKISAQKRRSFLNNLPLEIANAGDFNLSSLDEKYHSINAKSSDLADKMSNTLSQDTSVQFANKFIISDQKDTIGLTNEVFIKLRPGSNIKEHMAYLKSLGLMEIEQDSLDLDAYILTFPANTILKTANTLHESKKFEFADGNFLLPIKNNVQARTSVIPLYLRPLNNSFTEIKHPFGGFLTSVNDPYFRGNAWYAGPIGLQNAWDYSTGQGIIVAVIDNGVTQSHPDIINNLAANKGYDALGYYPDGRCVYGPNDIHGSECAGIVAETGNNSMGSAGIAYNSKVISIRFASGKGVNLFGYYFNLITPSVFYNSIVFARTNADIITLSWGVSSTFDAQDAALKNAATAGGRSGKGMPIFASAGNV